MLANFTALMLACSKLDTDPQQHFSGGSSSRIVLNKNRCLTSGANESVVFSACADAGIAPSKQAFAPRAAGRAGGDELLLVAANGSLCLTGTPTAVDDVGTLTLQPCAASNMGQRWQWPAAAAGTGARVGVGVTAGAQIRWVADAGEPQALCLSAAATANASARANKQALKTEDAAAAAVTSLSQLGGKPYRVSYDARSLRLNGRPLLSFSGSVHYVRSTPALWPAIFAGCGCWWCCWWCCW